MPALAELGWARPGPQHFLDLAVDTAPSSIYNLQRSQEGPQLFVCLSPQPLWASWVPIRTWGWGLCEAPEKPLPKPS